MERCFSFHIFLQIKNLGSLELALSNVDMFLVELQLQKKSFQVSIRNKVSKQKGVFKIFFVRLQVFQGFVSFEPSKAANFQRTRIETSWIENLPPQSQLLYPIIT